MRTIYRALFTLTLIVSSLLAVAQNKGLTFQEANEFKVGPSVLDNLYKSAIHVDSTLAVFQTEQEQQAMIEAYTKLLQDLGKFLNSNDFKWEKPTRCFNRVYFNGDGKIDYFLYNFSGNEEDKSSAEVQSKFQELLNKFIADYQIDVTAKEGFAQCSPTVYMPFDND